MGSDEFHEVLENAPPGIFDRRSWAYWNLTTSSFLTNLFQLPACRQPDEMSSQQKSMTVEEAVMLFDLSYRLKGVTVSAKKSLQNFAWTSKPGY